MKVQIDGTQGIVTLQGDADAIRDIVINDVIAKMRDMRHLVDGYDDDDAIKAKYDAVLNSPRPFAGKSYDEISQFLCDELFWQYGGPYTPGVSYTWRETGTYIIREIPE